MNPVSFSWDAAVSWLTNGSQEVIESDWDAGENPKVCIEWIYQANEFIAKPDYIESIQFDFADDEDGGWFRFLIYLKDGPIIATCGDPGHFLYDFGKGYDAAINVLEGAVFAANDSIDMLNSFADLYIGRNLGSTGN